MTFTIKSRKLSRRFDFILRGSLGYVWLEMPHGGYRQVCKGGGFMGSTIMSTPDSFERDCRNWYRSHIAN